MYHVGTWCLNLGNQETNLPSPVISNTKYHHHPCRERLAPVEGPYPVALHNSPFFARHSYDVP